MRRRLSQDLVQYGAMSLGESEELLSGGGEVRRRWSIWRRSFILRLSRSCCDISFISLLGLLFDTRDERLLKMLLDMSKLFLSGLLLVNL